MSNLKIYVDRVSQPARAVLIFCKINGIDFEEVHVDLAKGQHRLPQFKEINPVEEVPVIVDGTFKLFESHAILSYLACAKPGIPDHWYPRDLSARAKINSVLDWHHCHLRRGALSFVLSSKLAVIMNLNWKPLGLAEAEELLTVSLSRIESFWLDGKGKFLLGNSQPSIADLSLVCELMQLQVVDDKDRERILGPFRNVLQWMEDVKNATNPYFDEFHETLFNFKAILQSTQQTSLPELKLTPLWTGIIPIYAMVQFLVGNSQPSIADLSLVCELMQLQVVHDNDRERILGPHKKVVQWIEDVKNATNPFFDEVHEILFKVKVKLQHKRSKL